jgi:hypothetical protein
LSQPIGYQVNRPIGYQVNRPIGYQVNRPTARPPDRPTATNAIGQPPTTPNRGWLNTFFDFPKFETNCGSTNVQNHESTPTRDKIGLQKFYTIFSYFLFFPFSIFLYYFFIKKIRGIGV